MYITDQCIHVKLVKWYQTNGDGVVPVQIYLYKQENHQYHNQPSQHKLIAWSIIMEKRKNEKKENLWYIICTPEKKKQVKGNPSIHPLIKTTNPQTWYTTLSS